MSQPTKHIPFMPMPTPQDTESMKLGFKILKKKAKLKTAQPITIDTDNLYNPTIDQDA